MKWNTTVLCCARKWLGAGLVLVAVACETPAPARAPEVVVAATQSASAVPPTSSASASGEPTCACQKGGPAAAQAGSSNAARGPTIAYNGPLAGDVDSSMIETRIREAGGVPLRLTPKNQHLLDSAQALVLVGGDDIDPKRYGERPHDKLRRLSPEREAFDFELIEIASNLRLPVLGICLGAQELWVAARGTLIQDIPSEIGTKVNHRAKDALHPVTLVPGTKLFTIYGTKSLHVFSNHHQAVDDKTVPSDFVVSATSSDGVAEAFESSASNPAFVLGVGWHPEKRDQERVLFESLVAQAKRTPQPQAAPQVH